MDEPVRGVGSSSIYAALCKDCRRRGDKDPGFEYTTEWRAKVESTGGTASDRCPRCRKLHSLAIKLLAVPYVDLDTVGRVRDAENPTGPLGGLGPLPPTHTRSERRTDLATFAFGLTDRHATDLLRAFETKQVAVLVAGTGSGKSTFIPYRMMYPPAENLIRLIDRGQIIVTEPRRDATSSTAQMVAQVLCRSTAGPEGPVGYMTGENKQDFHGDTNGLVYITDGILVNWLKQGRLGSLGAIVIDEAHELNSNIEFALGYLAHERHRHPHLRILIASATINPQVFIDKFGGPDQVALMSLTDVEKDFGFGHPLWPLEEIDLDAPLWAHQDWARTWPGIGDLKEYTARLSELRVATKEVQPRKWQEAMPGLVAEQVLSILDGTEEGEVLAFLPGLAEINAAIAQIEPKLPKNTRLYPYLRDSPDSVKRAVRAPARAGRRRVIVATNIAETSLTIDGLRFVVDSGLIKRKTWDPATSSERMRTEEHSRFGVQQRWGRVGRKAPGWVFPLYTRAQYEALQASAPPQLTQSNLEAMLLNASAAGIADVEDLALVGADPAVGGEAAARNFALEVARAKRTLEARGATTQDGILTELGRELQRGTTSVGDRAAMLLADTATCTVEVATALAVLSQRSLSQNWFYPGRGWPSEAKLWARRHEDALRLGCGDDLDLVLRVMACCDAGSAEYALGPWVSQSAVRTAQATRSALMDGVSRRVNRGAGTYRSINFALADRARAVLFAALPDLILTRAENGSWLDNTGNAVELERDVAADAEEALGMVRFRDLRSGAIQASNLVLRAPAYADVTDRYSLLLAAAAEPALRDPGGEDRWAERIIGAPVGAIVRAASDDEGLHVTEVVARLDAPANLEPDDETDELDPEAALAEDDEAEVELDAAVDQDEPHADAQIPKRPLHLTPHARATQAPAVLIGDTARGEEYEVVGHVDSERGPVVALRTPAPAGRRVEVVEAVDCVVAGVSVRAGRCLVEVLESDGGVRWVVEGRELGLDPRDNAAGYALAVGASMQLTLTPRRRRVDPSLRPALGRHLQSLSQVPVLCSDGNTRRGYRATIVDDRGGWPRVRLIGSVPDASLIVEWGVRRDWLEGAGVQVITGAELVVTLSSPAECHTRARALPPAGVTLPSRFTIDENSGRLSYRGEISAQVRGQLRRLVSGDPEWEDAVDALWLSSLPFRASGVSAPPPDIAELRKAFPVGSVHEAEVVKVQRTSMTVVVAGGGPAVRIDQSAVGTGVLDVRTLGVQVGDNLTVRIAGTRESGEVAGSVDRVVPPLLAQLDAQLGGLRVTGSVQRTVGSKLLVQIAEGLVGACSLHQVPERDREPGTELTLEVTAASFAPVKKRPEIMLLRLDLSPERVAVEPPGGLGGDSLLPGTWPAEVIETTEDLVRVQFANGARRRIKWRSIGTHGLMMCDRSMTSGLRVDVEVGQATGEGKERRQNLRITSVPTPPIAEQVREHLVGREIDSVVKSNFDPGGRSFCEVWAPGRLDGSWPFGARRPDVGEKVRVRVTGAAIHRGKLQINVVRVD